MPATVAELRHQVPTVDDYMLSGTIPVPRGTFHAGGVRSLKVVDSDGRIVDDTQIDVVTRYPDAADGAAVVEVSARVRQHSTWPNGSLRSFNVVALDGGVDPDPGSPGIEDLIDGPDDVPASIQGLLADPESLIVVAHDPQGNAYVAYPLISTGTMKVMRYGGVRTCLRTYDTLVPNAPIAGNPYPHMMGVHSYLETFTDEEVLRLDLRINNGADDFDDASAVDDSMGKIYFADLSLYVLNDPAFSWVAQQQFEDPFSFHYEMEPIPVVSLNGKNYRAFPLVKPMPATDVQPVHMMPCKSQFLRRLAISPRIDGQDERARAILDLEGQGFARAGTNDLGAELWSWYNAETALYFPAAAQLPDLSFSNTNYGGLADLRAQLTTWFEDARDALRNNTGFPYGPEPGQSPSSMGWARPLGNAFGGWSGPQGINFLRGVRTLAASSRDGLAWLKLIHRLYTERQPNILYDRFGDPTYQDKWLVPAPGCSICPEGPGGGPQAAPFGFSMNATAFQDSRFCPDPDYDQTLFVEANGLEPDYDVTTSFTTNLNNYIRIDVQHAPRNQAPTMALIWISNDPLAKDDILAQGELFRMQYTEYPQPDGTYDGGLVEQVEFVNAFPGVGYETGRGGGWGMNGANAAFAVGDDVFRARMMTWYERIVDTMDRGLARLQDCFFVDGDGTPYSFGVLSSYENSAQFLPGCAFPLRARKSWQEMIVLNAVRGMTCYVFPDSAPQKAVAEDVLRQAALGMIAPISYNEEGGGIWGTIPVGDEHTLPGASVYECDPDVGCCPGAIPQPCCLCGPELSSNFYMWSTMAQGYLLTLDPVFLERVAHTFEVDCGEDCAASVASEFRTKDPTNVTNYYGDSNGYPLFGVVQGL